MKNQYIVGVGGNCLKIGGTWTIYRFKGGGLGEKEGVVFVSGRGLIPQCTLWIHKSLSMDACVHPEKSD